MFREIEIRSGERVLFLEIPDLNVVIDTARRATEGVVVGLGNADAVYAARRATTELDNVMFVAAGADDIPWQAGFFTLVVEPSASPGPPSDPDRAEREIRRVLAPGGRRVNI